MVLPASLGDYVFFDTDGDGVFSSGDTAVPGVVVNLLDGAGNPVLDGSSNPITTTTNASGAYQFTGLTAGGSYQVQFVAPIGQDFTTQDVGGDDTIDSDVDPATGLSQVVTLASGENNSTVDAGLIDEPIVPPLLGSIGNLVFEDLNNNGIRDAGDPGEPGVTIELLDGSGNPIVDSSGNPITTITDAAGFYEFTDLPAGDYRIRSSLPGGHFFTQQFAGSDTAIDSNVDGAGLSSFVTLGAGEHNPTVDVGISHFASLSSTIFFDDNGDGVQDTGDAGVANVVVNLIDSSGNQISTTTDSNGNYFFGDLRPGDFQIEVIAPAGMDFTLQHAAGDSAVDPTTGLSQVVTLASEENNTTLAVGLIDEPVDPPVVDPPVVDPPVVDPPVVDPPVIDPPVIDPPVIDPPVIDPPVVDPSTTSGSPANLPAPILLPLASQRFISAFVGSPNQNFSGFSIASNAHPLTLQTSRAVTGGYSSGFAIAGDYGAMTDQTYVDQGWIVEDQTYQSPYYYDAGEFIYGEDVAYGDMSQDGMFELELIVVDGADAWEAVVGQETVEFVMPPESAIVPPINNCNIRMPFLKRIHNWLHR